MNEPTKEGMYIIPTTCYKCSHPMNMAIMNRGNGFCGPEAFSVAEKSVAHDHGVIIEHHYSHTRQESYDAATCPHCNAFIGQHFIFTEYTSPVLYGDCDYKLVDVEQKKIIAYFFTNKPVGNKRQSDNSENNSASQLNLF